MVPAAAGELRERLGALEGTGGRLLAAHAEAVDKVNAQAGQLAALQAELARALAGPPAGAAPQNPAGAPPPLARRWRQQCMAWSLRCRRPSERGGECCAACLAPCCCGCSGAEACARRVPGAFACGKHGDWLSRKARMAPVQSMLQGVALVRYEEP